MKITPQHKISDRKAKELLEVGKPISDSYINGELRIEINENWEQEVVFENSIIDFFSGSTTPFKKPVRFKNCHFKNCQFVFTYFLGGLTIENCIFDNYLDFQAGGHNKNNNLINLSSNNFKSFVNFCDCWYESDVIICNNKFEKGTNLLGKPHNIPVRFDKTFKIENNLGQLDFDNENGIDCK